MLMCGRELVCGVCVFELFPFQPAQTWDLWPLSVCAGKMQAQRRTLKGLLVSSPTPLLSLSHLGSLVISVPLSQFSVDLMAHYDSALSRCTPFTLFLFSETHRHSHRLHTPLFLLMCLPVWPLPQCDETELPFVWTGTMMSDERRLCDGQKSNASSFCFPESCALLTTVNKHTHTDTCHWGHCQSSVMSVLLSGFQFFKHKEFCYV